MNKRFAISIPHAPVRGTTITVDAATFVEAKARAYEIYFDTVYAALSPAEKLAADDLIARRKAGGDRMSPAPVGGPWKPRLSAERLREIKTSLIATTQKTPPLAFR